MYADLKDKFLRLWNKYFSNAELPIIFFYTGDAAMTKKCSARVEHRCVIANLVQVRKGAVLRLDAGSVECSGGKRYLGFSQKLRPQFDYFLSYGIPGKLDGERYKKSPELVKKFMKKRTEFSAPGKYIVFKRFDLWEESEKLDVVIFFASADILSGLFTLANYDEDDNGVITPFGAGCGSIVLYPYLEKDSKNPRCILGMFDPSARPYVPSDMMTFAVPAAKFVRMVDNMEESFLITPTWNKIRQRMRRG